MGEFRTGFDERPGRIFLPGGEEALAIYSGNELIWAKFRNANVVVLDSANITIKTGSPSLYTESAVTLSVPRSTINVTASAPTVRADKAVNVITTNRPLVQIEALSPSVRADRRVDIGVPRADVFISAIVPNVIPGVSTTVEAQTARLDITAPSPEVEGKRAVNIEAPVISNNISVYEPIEVLARRAVFMEPIAATLTIKAFSPTVEINERITVQVPRAVMTITAFAPSVSAQRAALIDAPSMGVNVSVQAPTVIGGISTDINTNKGTLAIVAFEPNVSTILAKQKMNKVGDQLAPWNATGTHVIITGWTSDPAEPAIVVSDRLVISGSSESALVTLTYAFHNTDFNGSTVRVSLWRNDVQVATREDFYSNGVTSPDLSLFYVGPVVNGDQFEMRALRAYGSYGTFIASRTSMRVTPSEEIAFLRQKMSKSVTQNFSGTMPVQFTGFGADPSTPTNVVSDALQVIGSGLANIVVNLSGGTGNATLTIEVRVNGVPQTPIGLISTGTATFTVPTTLSHGDLITLWCTARSSTQRNITAASVEVVPFTPPETPTFT